MTNTEQQMGDNQILNCGFCRGILLPGSVYCAGCGAYKLKTSYKVEKIIVAGLFALLLPVGVAASIFVWMYAWPPVLHIAAVTTALIGVYFCFAIRKILKQWDFWHRG